MKNKQLHSKYVQFCGTCNYTIWKNEYIRYFNSKSHHKDCVASLTDPTPRRLNPKMQGSANEISKEKLITLLASKKKTRGLRNYTHKSSKGGARFIS